MATNNRRSRWQFLRRSPAVTRGNLLDPRRPGPQFEALTKLSSLQIESGSPTPQHRAG